MGARRRIDLGLSSTGISEHTALGWVVLEAYNNESYPEEKDFGVTWVPVWNARYGEHMEVAIIPGTAIGHLSCEMRDKRG